MASSTGRYNHSGHYLEKKQFSKSMANTGGSGGTRRTGYQPYYHNNSHYYIKKNPLPVDTYLKERGLKRKYIAKDGCCLFRAVAEQVWFLQSNHWALRRHCAHYIKSRADHFKSFLTDPIEDYCFKLSNSSMWGGEVELVALSELLDCYIEVFSEEKGKIATRSYNDKKKSSKDRNKNVLLAYTGSNHYDSVWRDSDERTYGNCQSIVYDLLYRQVFDDNWLPDKTHHLKLTEAMYPTDPLFRNIPVDLLKALSYYVYSNIPLELARIERQAREYRDRKYASDLQYKVGSSCQVNMDGHIYNAEITSSDTYPRIQVKVMNAGKRHTFHTVSTKQITLTNNNKSNAFDKRAGDHPKKTSSKTTRQLSLPSNSTINSNSKSDTSTPTTAGPSRSLTDTNNTPIDTRIPMSRSISNKEDSSQIKEENQHQSSSTRVSNRSFQEQSVSSRIKKDISHNKEERGENKGTSRQTQSTTTTSTTKKGRSKDVHVGGGGVNKRDQQRPINEGINEGEKQKRAITPTNSTDPSSTGLPLPTPPIPPINSIPQNESSAYYVHSTTNHVPTSENGPSYTTSEGPNEGPSYTTSEAVYSTNEGPSYTTSEAAYTTTTNGVPYNGMYISYNEGGREGIYSSDGHILPAFTEAPECEWPILNPVPPSTEPNSLHIDGPPPTECAPPPPAPPINQFPPQMTMMYPPHFLFSELEPPLHLLKNKTRENKQAFLFEYAQKCLRFYTKYVSDMELDDSLEELLCMTIDDFTHVSPRYNDGDFSVTTSSQANSEMAEDREATPIESHPSPGRVNNIIVSPHSEDHTSSQPLVKEGESQDVHVMSHEEEEEIEEGEELKTLLPPFPIGTPFMYPPMVPMMVPHPIFIPAHPHGYRMPPPPPHFTFYTQPQFYPQPLPTLTPQYPTTTSATTEQLHSLPSNKEEDTPTNDTTQQEDLEEPVKKDLITTIPIDKITPIDKTNVPSSDQVEDPPISNEAMPPIEKSEAISKFDEHRPRPFKKNTRTKHYSATKRTYNSHSYHQKNNESNNSNNNNNNNK